MGVINIPPNEQDALRRTDTEALRALDDLRLHTAVANHGQGVARGAAIGVVINRDVRHG